jgi:hypothetical protein
MRDVGIYGFFESGYVEPVIAQGIEGIAAFLEANVNVMS